MTCLGCNACEGLCHWLVDGRKVCSGCPDYRLECFAKEMLNKWTLVQRREHLAGLERTKHGLEEAAELRRVLNLLHAKQQAKKETAKHA